MKTKHYVLIGFSLFVLIAALTNPETVKHKEEVKLKMNAFLNKELNKQDNSQNDEWSQSGGLIGNAFASSMVNMMVENMISSSNYILFSTTNVTIEGKKKTIGFGFLGNVFLSGKIDEALKQ